MIRQIARITGFWTSCVAGGMGVVYKGEDTKLGRFVALKFLPSGLAPGPHVVAQSLCF